MLPITRRQLFFCVIVITLGIVIAGFWPIVPGPRNGAIVTKDGLSFEEGIAFTPAPGLFLSRTSDHTVELLIRPSGKPSNGVQEIVSAIDDHFSKQFEIAQWHSLLMFDIRGPAGHVERVGFDVLTSQRWCHVIVELSRIETAIYIDGAKRYSGKPVWRDDAVQPLRLVLGNSADAAQPWNGTTAYLRIKGAAPPNASAAQPQSDQGTQSPSSLLEFNAEFRNDRSAAIATAKGDIYVPPDLIPLRRRPLRWDFVANRSGFIDVFANVIGFIPFGAAVAAYLVAAGVSRIRSTVIAIGLAGLLSLLIEAVQAYMVGRSSSSTDLLMNTFGAVLGTLILIWFGDSYQSKSPVR